MDDETPERRLLEFVAEQNRRAVVAELRELRGKACPGSPHSRHGRSFKDEIQIGNDDAEDRFAALIDARIRANGGEGE